MTFLEKSAKIFVRNEQIFVRKLIPYVFAKISVKFVIYRL